jgi:hypothetical protein
MEDEVPEVLVVSDERSPFRTSHGQKLAVRTTGIMFCRVDDIVAFGAKPSHNGPMDVLVYEEFHSGSGSVNAFVEPNDGGRIQASGPEMLGPQARMAPKQFLFAHRPSQFLQDVLYRDAGSLEDGFSHHHVGAFLNVVFPSHQMFPVS